MRVIATISVRSGSAQVVECPLPERLGFLETKFLRDEVGLLCVICNDLRHLSAPLAEHCLAPPPVDVMQVRALALGDGGVSNVPKQCVLEAKRTSATSDGF